MWYDNFDLTEYNGYRINARCKSAFLPKSKGDLLEFLNENARDSFKILGSGHNVILQNQYYDSTLLILSENYSDMMWDSFSDGIHKCTSLSGTSLKRLSLEALKFSASGLEYFYDIPSSLGGAVIMNAGTRDATIGDLIEWVGVYDYSQGKYRIVEKDWLEFRYRNSALQEAKDKIIVDVGLKLNSGNADSIECTMKNQKTLRWSKQPRELPNCGSVFKRPSGRYVGPMIESLGLKGYCVGDACVSEKHAGFIVNKGSATGVHILKLIEHIKAEVIQAYDVELEVEQRIL